MQPSRPVLVLHQLCRRLCRLTLPSLVYHTITCVLTPIPQTLANSYMKVPTASGGPLNCPVLSQVARRVLTISASSAQSERDFSSVGHTLTDLRTRLSANKVEAVELLRCGPRAGMHGARVTVMVQYNVIILILVDIYSCLLYTSPSPRD